MEGASQGEGVEVGGSWKVEEVGCQEEEVGLGTKMHLAAGVLVGQ